MGTLRLFRLALLPVLSASLWLAAGCTPDEVPATSDNSGLDGIRVNLAVRVAPTTVQNGTRTGIPAISEIQETPDFRGMRDIYLIPFDVHNTVSLGDEALSAVRHLDDISDATDAQAVSGDIWHSGLVANNSAHLYKGIYLPKSTGAVLVYGRAVAAGSDAEDSQAFKQLNGSLIMSGIAENARTDTPAEVTFTPDPIYNSNVTPAAAGSLVALLNQITGSSYTFTQEYYRRNNATRRTTNITLSWNGSLSGDTKLTNFFNEFTAGGNPTSGSGTSIAAVLTNLYRSLQSYQVSDNTTNYPQIGGQNPYASANSTSDRLKYGHVYKSFCDAICTRIAGLSGVTVTGSGTSATVTLSDANLAGFPGNLGLPAGCAAIKWNGSAFAVVNNSDPEAGMTERNKYCYPPYLWYYTNSQIKTSNVDNESEHYIAAKNTWSDILDEYVSGNAVSVNTKAVAVRNPLRYGVALLSATIQANAAVLADNDGNNATNVTLGANTFPLRAIVIGNQRVQYYNFTPNVGSDVEYVLYDTNLGDASGNTLYLTNTESAPFKTLVLQTPDNTNITFALEFQNNSGDKFYGKDGQVIPAGGNFYLIGILDIKSRDEAERTVGGMVLNSVFTQAYKTTVSFKVSSLENAVNTIPDMRAPRLGVGVTADVNWIQVTPTSVPLY